MKLSSQAHFRTKQLAILGLLAAISIVAGKLPSPDILGGSVRVGIENLPTIFAGIVFGPISGMFVGIISDVVGGVIKFGGINFFLTIGAASVGFVSGIFGFKTLANKKKSFFYIFLPVAAAHVIGSIIIKTPVLQYMFGMPWHILLPVRSAVYTCNIIVESIIIYFLLKSKAIRHALKGFVK